MTNHKILLVDDDRDVLEMLLSIFQRAGYTNLRTASSGAEALRIRQEEHPSLIVLDVMMPGMDGFSVLKEIRRTSRVPVLMLTARGEAEDRIEGLEIGADDYLAKPFGMMEMVSRIRAVLRRTARQPSGVLSCGGVTLDEGRHAVTVNDRPVSLTLKEYELLKLFLENIGHVFSREALLSRVWDADYAGETRTVDVHVGTLRTKLAECGGLIETVRGVGYKMEGVK